MMVGAGELMGGLHWSPPPSVEIPGILTDAGDVAMHVAVDAGGAWPIVGAAERRVSHSP
jgi:hypothetical protein